MTEETQSIETIRERDTDILLLEELNVNDHFATWFAQKLLLPDFTKNNGAWRSITDSGLGETDLLFSYNSLDAVIFVLIENKLDADFQERQFDRYQLRGERYILDKKCSKYFSVLFAPRQYAEDQSDFERYISYEDVKEYFETDGNKRQLFKADLLKIAIEKLKRGYNAINCEPAQKFVQSYWKYKQENFPEILMKKPSVIPRESDWIYMKSDKLKDILLVHKLEMGLVDAMFRNYSEGTELRMKEILPPDYTIVKFESGRFSIRQNTPIVQKMSEIC